MCLKVLRNFEAVQFHNFFHSHQVYVAEIECDQNVAVSRNVHKRTEDEVKQLSENWDPTPSHYNKLDLRSFLQDKEIAEVEMEEVSADESKLSDEKDRDSKSDDKHSDPGDEDEVRFVEKRRSDFVVIIE